MNILIHTIASPYGKQSVGGAETSMKLIAEKLAQQGHNVVFFCKEEKKSCKAYTVKKINGVEVYTFTKLLLPIDTYRVRLIAKKMHHRLFLKVLSKKKIDVIYTYYNLSLCKEILSYKKYRDFSLIIRIAGMRWAEQIKKKPRLKKEYLQVFNQADSLNFISSGLENMFFDEWKNFGKKLNISHKKTLDIGTNIVDLPSNLEINKESGYFQMAMISRLSTYQKRQDILIEAMGLIAPDLPIHLTLVGNGKRKDKLQKQIDNLKIQSRVTVKPFISQKQLWEFMSQIDLLCHACDYEGLGKIIIESLGMGLPVLASDVQPLNTYIIDGKTGFLVKNTPEAWATRIKELYESERSRLKRVGLTAHNFIVDNFDADKNVVEYERYFKECIDSYKFI